MTRLRKPSIHPDFKKALQSGAQEADVHQRTVRVLTKVVAEALEELHGGKWRVDIDHAVGFVLLTPARDWEVRS